MVSAGLFTAWMPIVWECEYAVGALGEARSDLFEMASPAAGFLHLRGRGRHRVLQPLWPPRLLRFSPAEWGECLERLHQCRCLGGMDASQNYRRHVSAAF